MQTDKIVNPSNAQYANGTEVGHRLRHRQGRRWCSGRRADTRSLAKRHEGRRVRRRAGSAPVPEPAGGKPVTSMVAGINLAIFKNTKNKDAALKFVKFMTSTRSRRA